MVKSIEFKWDVEKIEKDYNLVKYDDGVNLALKYLNNDKSKKILEAGSGNGRVLKYLLDLGYKKVEGIELNSNIVSYLNSKFPYMKIYQGDIVEFSFKKKYDMIIALGLIEHFKEGVNIPLKKFYEILEEDGIAVVTVPCFNLYRKIRYFLSRINPRNRNRKKNKKGENGYMFNVSPLYGEFFEYWMTKKELKMICISQGFKIIKTKELSHHFCTYHIFKSLAGSYDGQEVKLNLIGKILNNILKTFPCLNNHMLGIVLRKSKDA